MLASLEQRDIERLLQKTGLPEFTPNTQTSPVTLFEDLDQIRSQGWSSMTRNGTPACGALPLPSTTIMGRRSQASQLAQFAVHE